MLDKLKNKMTSKVVKMVGNTPAGDKLKQGLANQAKGTYQVEKSDVSGGKEKIFYPEGMKVDTSLKYSGKGTKARLNTAASKMMFGSKYSK